MINGNGRKCKSTANKYALSAVDLLEHNLTLMECGNTLVHRAGIINAQLLHDMDTMAVNRFMSNAEQGGNTLVIIVGNQQFEDLALSWRQLFAQPSRWQFAGASARLTIEEKEIMAIFR